RTVDPACGSGIFLRTVLELQYNPFGLGNRPLISVIVIGEIKSFATQSEWGAKRWAELHDLLDKFIKLDIRYGIIDDRYAEIDTFSQNKLPQRPLGLTPRNMGKNDLWIAATASVLGAKLLTTDGDFNHLHGVFLDLEQFSH
ncbi:MAG: PIN domain-containing protein, partial [Saprospiraceae bacterium]|nr:PIN domain-containing protein [Saprospiraceae bacterium]